MGNEKVNNIDERIRNMTDAEICEILIDKDGWQEEMYSRAIEEAKNRKLDSISYKPSMRKLNLRRKRLLRRS
jgi:hypothetical protein